MTSTARVATTKTLRIAPRRELEVCRLHARGSRRSNSSNDRVESFLAVEEVLVLVLVLMEQGPLTKDPPSKNRPAGARLDKIKS